MTVNQKQSLLIRFIQSEGNWAIYASKVSENPIYRSPSKDRVKTIYRALRYTDELDQFFTGLLAQKKKKV